MKQIQIEPIKTGRFHVYLVGEPGRYEARWHNVLKFGPMQYGRHEVTEEEYQYHRTQVIKHSKAEAIAHNVMKAIKREATEHSEVEMLELVIEQLQKRL